MIIGSFRLAGATWTIVLDEGYGGDGIRWKKNYPTHTITIYGKHKGIVLTYDRISRNLWDVIVFIILANIMIKTKDDLSSYCSGFSLLLHQVDKTLALTTDVNTSEVRGWFSLGAVNYSITTDNYTCTKDIIDGRMNPNTSSIIIKTKDILTKTLSSPEFINQIIWHEIVHAINSELGYSESKQDKESFVNVLASFLFEVHTTLNLNIDGTNKETIKTT